MQATGTENHLNSLFLNGDKRKNVSMRGKLVEML